LVSSPETRETGFAAAHESLMGQWRSVPQPPEGTLVVGVSGNDCCGRNIDSLLLMAKPHFVQMTHGQWQQFITDIGLLVKSYSIYSTDYLLCSVMLLVLLFAVVMLQVCLNLSFGVVNIVGGIFLGGVMSRFISPNSHGRRRHTRPSTCIDVEQQPQYQP
jgi:hypothetical protein